MAARPFDRLASIICEAQKIEGVDSVDVEPLSGGAIQENRLVSLTLKDGSRRDYVLRADAPAVIRSSRSRQQEFRLVEVAYANGVTVARPVMFCSDANVIGKPFALFEKVAGIGFGPAVVKSMSNREDRGALAERLGRELARIHGIPMPDPRLAFLEPAPVNAWQSAVDNLRAGLDALDARRPALEWALRWAEVSPPRGGPIGLTHGDFRTGNYMVSNGELTAVLDWEFAGYGDVNADIGWFCAKCWRFQRSDREAGGIADRADFYRGYERECGNTIDPSAVAAWEVMAHARWAVIALEQGARHASGRESSLELALTGRIASELEYALIRMTPPKRWTTRDG